MLHQIELYRAIPKLKAEIRGFIEETQARIADSQDTIKRLKGTGRQPDIIYREKMSRPKYTDRMHKAEKTLIALTELHRCLDE